MVMLKLDLGFNSCHSSWMDEQPDHVVPGVASGTAVYRLFLSPENDVSESNDTPFGISPITLVQEFKSLHTQEVNAH